MLGFKPKSSLKLHHNIRHSLFLFPDESVRNYCLALKKENNGKFELVGTFGGSNDSHGQGGHLSNASKNRCVPSTGCLVASGNAFSG